MVLPDFGIYVDEIKLVYLTLFNDSLVSTVATCTRFTYIRNANICVCIRLINCKSFPVNFFLLFSYFTNIDRINVYKNKFIRYNNKKDIIHTHL